MARKRIPPQVEEAVLVLCRRRCCLCYGLNRDISIKPGQIAHLDGRNDNNDLDNLAFMCFEHHDHYDSRTSQSKGLTPQETRRFRKELHEVIERAWNQPVAIGAAVTEEVDALRDRIKDRIEIIEGPHNMFYGMREVIVRDLNGFWITFGQAIPAEVLTPWPLVDSALLQPYKGRYQSDSGSAVLITIHEGRLLAFPEDAPGVFLKPKAEHTFTPFMSQQASVSFEGTTELMTLLTFEQDGKAMRFVRAR